MKKNIVLFIIMMLLTGCSAEYNLYLEKEIDEETFIYENNDILNNLDYYDMDSSDDEYAEEYIYEVSKFEGNFNYKREEVTMDDASGYRYKAEYKYDKMEKESMIYDCYENIDISYKDNISLKTSNQFKCFEKFNMLENVTVKIYYNGKLINTNADSYENGIYIWKIDKNNYNNKPIILEVERNKENYIFEIISCIIFIILSAIALLIYRKRNIKE